MTRDESPDRTSAVILVGHGTRDAVGAQEFFTLASRLARQLSPTPVEPCLLEFQKPSLAETWTQLTQLGATHIHVAPLLLFAAGHAKADIPNIVAACQRETPTVSFDQSRSISRHRSIIDLVVKRITETMGQSSLACQPGDPLVEPLERCDQSRRLALVMVGRGNRDPCAQADMRVLSEIVSGRVNVAGVFTAFYAMARPSLVDVFERVAQSGRFDAVVVHPHLLFAGRLFQAISDQVDQARQRFPGIEFRLSGYLGPDVMVAAAIADRIDQAAATSGHP